MRISVDGNIGSGKSECLRALAAALPDVPCFPEPVEEWGPLLELYYASPAEWALAFQLKVLLGFRAPAQCDAACLVERSPLTSRHVFGQLLYNDGLLNQQEWEVFKEYSDVLGWKPDVIFFIDTPADVCLERVAARDRPGERPIAFDYLRRLDFQMQNMLRFADVPVVRFDGRLPPADLHAAVLAEARAWLHKGDSHTLRT